VLVAGACLYVAAFVATAAARLLFAYPLEITEGASLEAVRGLLRGQPLYDQPTSEHVPMIYGPVYFYLAALISLVIGPSYAALRLVSLVASVGSVALISLLIKRETHSASVAILAAGLFTASYPLTDGALDLGRVDALLVCMLLAAVYASRLSGLRSAILAGACTALALLTKQSALPVSLVLLLYLAVTSRRRLIGYATGLAVTLASPLALLEAQSGHWATLFLILLPRQHDISELRLTQFWTLDVLPRFTLALVLGMLFACARLTERDRTAPLFFGLVSLGMLGIAWASDTNVGAAPNVLLPAYAVLAILFALGLHEALRQLARLPRQRRAFWAFGVGVGIFQLLLLAYNPRLLAPYRSEAWADERLASALNSLPGTLFAPDFDAYMPESGRPEQPYSGPAAELIGSYGGFMRPEGEVWLESVRQQLQQRAFDHVVLDPESNLFFFKGVVTATDYVDTGPLFPAGDEFWLWRTGRIPKAEVYVPRERAPSGASTTTLTR
jgi:4-amino-4-deoxy-L-arabinose transferase-like glycosyltransferase